MNIKNAITKVLKSGLFINLLVLLIVLGVILAEKDRIIGYFAGTGEHGNLLSSHSLVRFLASFLIAVFVCGYYLIYHRFNVRKKNRAELGFALILFILSLVSAGVFSVFFVIILGVLDKINFGYELMNLVYIGLVGFFIGFSSKIGILEGFILTKARKLVLRDIFQPIDLIILLVIILLFGVLYLIDPAILYFEAAIIGVSVLAYLSSIFVPYQILKFR